MKLIWNFLILGLPFTTHRLACDKKIVILLYSLNLLIFIYFDVILTSLLLLNTIIIVFVVI